MGFNEEGYDREGYDRRGYDRDGYGRDGFDRLGYTRDGYGRDGKYLEIMDFNRRKKKEELGNLIEEDKRTTNTLEELLEVWDKLRQQEENVK